MNFQIHNRQGTFELNGHFNATNTEKVKEHFNYLLDHYEEVIMCLNNVNKIDRKALEVLNDIYKKSVRRSKILFVLGSKNKVVSTALKNNQLYHILRNDY